MARRGVISDGEKDGQTRNGWPEIGDRRRLGQVGSGVGGVGGGVGWSRWGYR